MHQSRFNRIRTSLVARASARAFDLPTIISSLLTVAFCLISGSVTVRAASIASSDFVLLRSTDTGLCLPAIERLGASHDSDVATPVLIQAFSREKRATVRRYEIEALGRLRSSDSVPTLTQALNDPDVQTRQSAIVALESVGGSDAETALFQQVNLEKNFAAKAYLIRVLGRSKNAKAEKLLQSWSGDNDANVRRLVQEELDRKAKEKRRLNSQRGAIGQ